MEEQLQHVVDYPERGADHYQHEQLGVVKHEGDLLDRVEDEPPFQAQHPYPVQGDQYHDHRGHEAGEGSLRVEALEEGQGGHGEAEHHHVGGDVVQVGHHGVHLLHVQRGEPRLEHYYDDERDHHETDQRGAPQLKSVVQGAVPQAEVVIEVMVPRLLHRPRLELPLLLQPRPAVVGELAERHEHGKQGREEVEDEDGVEVQLERFPGDDLLGASVEQEREDVYDHQHRGGDAEQEAGVASFRISALEESQHGKDDTEDEHHGL